MAISGRGGERGNHRDIRKGAVAGGEGAEERGGPDLVARRGGALMHVSWQPH